MKDVRIGDAVIAAIEGDSNNYQELKIEDFKANPLRMVMGLFKEHSGNKYFVDILNNWFGLHGTICISESALGVPIEAEIENTIGKELKIVGAVKWNADFNSKEIEAFTETGKKIIPSNKIKRITSWI